MKTLSLITTRDNAGNSEPTLRQLRRSGARSLMQQNKPYPGMAAVVMQIKEIIETYRNKQFVRDLAMQLTAHIAKNTRSHHPDMRNFDAIAKAIYSYVVKHAIYTRDPNQIERLQAPDATILSGAGDCDDMVILSASLLESVGVPTRIRLLGEQPNTFTHILLEYKSNGRWLSFDPTLALYPGYEIPKTRIKAEKIVPITHTTAGAAGAPGSITPSTRRTGSSFVH